MLQKLLSLLEVERQTRELQTLRDSHSKLLSTTLTDFVVPVGASCANEERSVKQLFNHASKTAQVTRGLA